MSYHVENALKRATELIDVGQKAQALRDLSDVIDKERRQYRRMWTKTLEDAVLLLVRLSCELRDNAYIKNTLSSYRHMAQTQAPGSLELVIKEMLDLSEEKVNKALQQCGKTAQSVEELDLDGQDAVSAELDRAQRSEQALLIPWLKFTWENLRNVLDILRNNVGLEQSYHATAHRAFKFCQTYHRKVEFRRLCELLRSHLSMQSKYTSLQPEDTAQPPAQFRLSGESMELHLQTRFEQLKVATDLRLWAEGFKSVDDVSTVINFGLRKPSAQLMATYYSKLAQLFLASGSMLFHCLALRAYYELNRDKNKSLTRGQIEQMANQCVLAAMAVPLQNREAMLVEKEKNHRMSVLCGFDFNPCRDSVLALFRLDGARIVEDCSSDVRDLFYALEHQSRAPFDPQTLVERMAPKLKQVRSDAKLHAYAQPLDHLLLVRLVAQLAKVFSIIRLEQFHSLVKQMSEVGGAELTPLQAEVLVVRAVRHRHLEQHMVIKIDHGMKHIKFVQHVVDAPQTKFALKELAKGLQAIIPAEAPEEQEEEDLAACIARESLALEQRRATVQQRKQEIASLAVFREKQRVEREEALRQERQEQERLWVQKIAQEEQKRKEERAEKERVQQLVEMDLRINGFDVEAIKTITTAASSGGEFLSMQDKDKLIRDKQEKQQNQAVEQEKRIQAKTKKFDSFVRALRDAERPKLVKMEEERQIREAKEEEAEKVQREEEFQKMVAAKLQAKQDIATMFSPQVLDKFLQDIKPAMLSSHQRVKQQELDLQYERKMEEKLQRAMQRKQEQAKTRKQEMEDTREQQRLEEDAKKREAKLNKQ